MYLSHSSLILRGHKYGYKEFKTFSTGFAQYKLYKLIDALKFANISKQCIRNNLNWIRNKTQSIFARNVS